TLVDCRGRAGSPRRRRTARDLGAALHLRAGTTGIGPTSQELRVRKRFSKRSAAHEWSAGALLAKGGSQAARARRTGALPRRPGPRRAQGNRGERRDSRESAHWGLWGVK